MVKIFLAIIFALGAIISVIEVVKLIRNFFDKERLIRSLCLLLLLMGSCFFLAYLYYLDDISEKDNPAENPKVEKKQSIVYEKTSKNKDNIKENIKSRFSLMNNATMLVDYLIEWEDPLFKKIFTEYFGKEDIYTSDLREINEIKLYGDDFAYINDPHGDINLVSKYPKFSNYLDKQDKRYIYKEENFDSKIFEYGKYISLNDIKNFPNLESLSIYCFYTIDCSIFSQLQLKKLQYLDISSCDLNNDQFISVCNQLQLSSLNLSRNNITNIDNITNLIDLERLGLRKNDISDISSLSFLHNLEWLALDGNNITNISPLKNLPKLKYVDITGCPIEDYSPVEFVDEVNR